MPISSHLSNLPNQVIYGVMWSSDLKSCGKMLSNDIYMTYWSNLPNWAVYRVMWLLHWIPHQPKYFCPLYKHIYRYIPPYLASQLPAPGYCCEHHDVPCESTQVTSWCYYKDASPLLERNLPFWGKRLETIWWNKEWQCLDRLVKERIMIRNNGGILMTSKSFALLTDMK